MKILLISAAIVYLLSGAAYGKGDKYETNIDSHKKEATVNIDKDGKIQGVISEGNKRPAESMSERDRRQDQQNTQGAIGVRINTK